MICAIFRCRQFIHSAHNNNFLHAHTLIPLLSCPVSVRWWYFGHLDLPASGSLSRGPSRALENDLRCWCKFRFHRELSQATILRCNLAINHRSIFSSDVFTDHDEASHALISIACFITL